MQIARTRTPTTESLMATVRKDMNAGNTMPVAPVRNNSFQIGYEVLTESLVLHPFLPSVAPNADSNHNTAEGEALDSEEYCRQLLTQALELTQNENLRMALQEIIDNEFGGGSNNIDFSRLTTAEVSFFSFVFSRI